MYESLSEPTTLTNEDQFLSDYVHQGNQPTNVMPTHVHYIHVVYKRQGINVLATERPAPFTIQITDIQCTCIYSTCIMTLAHPHTKQTNLKFHCNMFQRLREHVQGLVQMSFVYCKKAFEVSFERVANVERTLFVSRSNTLGFTFKHV